MKYLLFLVTVTFSYIAHSAYTEMVIEGVKQSNGVWTTAGVMDTQGFVRTTGAVTVSGATRNLPVALQADVAASSVMLRSAARLAGPVALAATAYEVYQWVLSSPSIDAADNQWIAEQMNTATPAVSVTYNISTYGGNACPSQSTCSLDAALTWLNTGNGYKPVVITGYSKPTTNADGTVSVKMTCTSKFVGARCDINAKYPVNPFSVTDMESRFNSLPIPSTSILANGFNNIPSLSGSRIPIKGVSFTPFSEWASDPYFKDGNWWRDRMDVSPAPTPEQPTRVRVDYGPVKLEGQTDPTTTPNTGPADGNTQPKEQTKFCDDNPGSIACAEMGKLEKEELEVKELPVNTSYTPWGSSNSTCPSPRTIPIFDKTISISYQPICDFVLMLRPLIIGMALVSAALIIGGFRRSGGGE